MSAVVDITDQRFGRLVALTRSGYKESAGQKQITWLCQCDCGTSKIILGSSLRSGQSKSCGCAWKDAFLNKKREKAHNWKGGRHVRKDGYVRVLYPEHPYASGGTVLEHRLVMESYLGRVLQASETVHHKNGIRCDNRIENLELRAGPHGRGQNTKDLVFWAESVLKQYAPEKLA